MRDPSISRRLTLWPGVKITLYSSFVAWLFVKWLQNKNRPKINVIFVWILFLFFQNKLSIIFLLLNKQPTLKPINDGLKSLFEHGVTIKILYGSVTGKSKHFATEFMKKCLEKGFNKCDLVDLKDYDPEESLFSEVFF